MLLIVVVVDVVDGPEFVDPVYCDNVPPIVHVGGSDGVVDVLVLLILLGLLAWLMLRLLRVLLLWLVRMLLCFVS